MKKECFQFGTWWASMTGLFLVDLDFSFQFFSSLCSFLPSFLPSSLPFSFLSQYLMYVIYLCLPIFPSQASNPFKLYFDSVVSIKLTIKQKKPRKINFKMKLSLWHSQIVCSLDVFYVVEQKLLLSRHIFTHLIKNHSEKPDEFVKVLNANWSSAFKMHCCRT